MKIFSTLILVMLAATSMKAQDFNASMAEIMINMKTYTEEILDLIPESSYDYRPVDSVRTFQEQIIHMIATNHFLLNHFLKNDSKSTITDDLNKAIAYANNNESSKLTELLGEQMTETISFFQKATNDYYLKKYTFGTPEQPIIKDYFTTAMLIRDHLSHHRAQLIVYLRLNEIAPTQYRGF